nr:hypothetical protein Iba_chr12fCG16860 [Ipomoea batatas]
MIPRTSTLGSIGALSMELISGLISFEVTILKVWRHEMR